MSRTIETCFCVIKNESNLLDTPRSWY